jgi:hypothetical protein
MKMLAILVLVVSAPASAATPWETYLALPTPENASRVTAIEYSTPRQGGYDAGDFGILETQVSAADVESFRLAYRLYNGSEAGLAEDLGAILSGSIRSHPRFFLRQVEALDPTCSGFGWILNAPGVEYVDRPAAAAYELRMRVAALDGVNDRSLSTIGSKCSRLIRALPGNETHDRLSRSAGRPGRHGGE